MPKSLSCVLLADRHHGLTEGVRGLLATEFGSVVMVSDEASLIEGAGRLQPDMAVVDISLARDSKLAWLQALRENCPDLKVILLSVHDEQSVRDAVLRAGADAFVLKRAIAGEWLNAFDAPRPGKCGEGQFSRMVSLDESAIVHAHRRDDFASHDGRCSRHRSPDGSAPQTWGP